MILCDLYWNLTSILLATSSPSAIQIPTTTTTTTPTPIIPNRREMTGFVIVGRKRGKGQFFCVPSENCSANNGQNRISNFYPKTRLSILVPKTTTRGSYESPYSSRLVALIAQEITQIA